MVPVSGGQCGIEEKYLRCESHVRNFGVNGLISGIRNTDRGKEVHPLSQEWPNCSGGSTPHLPFVLAQ